MWTSKDLRPKHNSISMKEFLSKISFHGKMIFVGWGWLTELQIRRKCLRERFIDVVMFLIFIVHIIFTWFYFLKIGPLPACFWINFSPCESQCVTICDTFLQIMVMMLKYRKNRRKGKIRSISQYPVEIWTYGLKIMRRVHYHCATTSTDVFLVVFFVNCPWLCRR